MLKRAMAVVLLAATHAGAESREGALQLSWQAPASCPNEAAMIRKVELQLGHPLDTGPSAVAANALVLVGKDGHFQVVLETVAQGETHDRTLDGSSCDALADAVALVLAFLIDPDAVAARSAPATDPQTQSESTGSTAGPSRATVPLAPNGAPPKQAEGEPPSAAPGLRNTTPAKPQVILPAQPKSARRWQRPWSARALVGVDSGALPSTTIFGGIALGGAFGRLALQVSGLAFSPRERLVSSVPVARGGKFQLEELGAAAGYRVLSQYVELTPFLGLEAGTVQGSGFGVVEPKQGKGLWLAATGAVQGRHRLLPWLGVEAEASAAVPFARPQYGLDNVGVVYQSEFITFRGAIGLEAYF